MASEERVLEDGTVRITEKGEHRVTEGQPLIDINQLIKARDQAKTARDAASAELVRLRGEIAQKEQAHRDAAQLYATLSDAVRSASEVNKR